jgi:hypothetical protein
MQLSNVGEIEKHDSVGNSFQMQPEASAGDRRAASSTPVSKPVLIPMSFLMFGGNLDLCARAST